uniref:Sulfotransferase n=1 Tax=Roseihalotalea indica TaxID=2867963 RepID=A0AA49GJY4_9BACT|nr:sulfotransferase [Tunicatimonas sp. TK19036]
MIDKISNKISSLVKPDKQFKDKLQIHFPPRTMRESMARNEKVKHLLIIGLPRSGTSIFQRIMNSFSGVFVAFESIYMPFLGDNSVESLQAYFFEMIKQYHHLAVINRDILPKERIKPFTFDETYHYFGDKAIYNTSDDFRSRLKKAADSNIVDKIIFIVRDPRDRMNSYFNWVDYRDEHYTNTVKPSDRDVTETIRKESEKWNKFAEDVLHYDRNYDKCITVTYEDLVKPQAKGIDRVISHLQLPSDEINLDYYHSSVSRTSIDKWKEELDADISRQITEYCKDYMARFNYQK